MELSIFTLPNNVPLLFSVSLNNNCGLSIRLRASEPVSGSSQHERFQKILATLPTWVHRSTKIITDFSVDREALISLGFK